MEEYFFSPSTGSFSVVVVAAFQFGQQGKRRLVSLLTVVLSIDVYSCVSGSREYAPRIVAAHRCVHEYLVMV